MAEAALFWLLLPLAAMSGWYAHGRARPRRPDPSLNRFSTSYFRGLNYLLNEQPDKAIEVFLKIAEVDSDTVETHLALGNLFRRRGEVDRAIRFHQNLIERETLSPEQRTAALLELGEDYMRAGLLDRAERLFTELTEIGAHTPSALRHLIAIYQQEKDWEKSIEQARRLEKIEERSMAPTIAQFYCEMAEAELEEGRRSEAQSLVGKALATDNDCVRASLLKGRMAREVEDYDEAIRAYRKVEEQDIDYIPEVLEPLIQSYSYAGREEECKTFLRAIIDRYRGISPVLALADLLAKHEGQDVAVAFISGQLKRRPSVRGLEQLIGMNLEAASEESRDNLLILRELTRRLLEGQPIYRCSHCGFGTKMHHWQCPSCKTWNNVKPIYGVAGE